MKVTVVRSTEFEIAEIEFFEIAQYVDAVFRFVVAVASVAYLIGFRFDVLIASVAKVVDVDALTDVSIDASIALRWLLVSDIIDLMNLVWN